MLRAGIALLLSSVLAGCTHSHGVVTLPDADVVNFPAGTTLRQTLLATVRELPSDATLLWRTAMPECTIAQYRSAELARLDPANLPGGLVGVASETTPRGGRYLDFIPFDLHRKLRC